MGNKYDDLDKNALDILMDYSEGIFPLDLEHICEKLRIKLIPYSNVSKEKLEEVHAFASNGELKDGCTILLNHPDEDGWPIIEIAYHPESTINEGCREPVVHYHLYNGLSRDAAKKMTTDLKEKYSDYLKEYDLYDKC